MLHVLGTAGESCAAPRPCQVCKKAETTQNSQAKPNQPPVSAMHPGFLYIDGVI